MVGDKTVKDDILVFRAPWLRGWRTIAAWQSACAPQACLRRASPARQNPPTGGFSGRVRVCRRLCPAAAPPARLATDSLHQKLLSRSIRPESAAVDLQQLVGHPLPARCGNWLSVRATPGARPASGLARTGFLPGSGKKVGWTIWLESPLARNWPGFFSVFSTSASCTVVMSCTSSSRQNRNAAPSLCHSCATRFRSFCSPASLSRHGISQTDRSASRCSAGKMDWRTPSAR